MTPLVSILIPVFNRANLVCESIESGLAQTYTNIEIIIVDNCSTDGTWEVLNHYAQKDKRIRIFQNSENVGPVKNWKRCIEEAKGEYAKILFSDDLIATNFIEQTLRLIDADTAFVLSPLEIFSESHSKTLGIYQKKKVHEKRTYIENILLFNQFAFPVSPGAALFRTSDLISALEIEIENPLNLNFTTYGAGNDLLIYLNIANNYEYVKVAQTTKALFRSHQGSFSISNPLNIYYDFSKYYFAQKHAPHLLSKMKAILWQRKKRNRTDGKIFNLIEGRIDIGYIFRILIKRYFD